MSKVVTLAAGAVGFLLGSRAGRAPYERFSQKVERVMGDPRVRGRAGKAEEMAREKAGQAAEWVRTAGARTGTSDSSVAATADGRSERATAGSSPTAVVDSGAGAHAEPR